MRPPNATRTPTAATATSSTAFGESGRGPATAVSAGLLGACTGGLAADSRVSSRLRARTTSDESPPGT